MKRRTKKILLIVFLLVITSWVIIAIIPRGQNYQGVNPLIKNQPILIAHGGGNKEFPDNTLEAFYHAYSIDPNCMMETDVSITKDNVVILSHDITLDRKTSLRNQKIIDVNYADLIKNEVDFSYENEVVNGYNVTGKLSRYRNYLQEEVTPLDVIYPEGVNPRHDQVFLVTTLEELIKAFPNNLINVEIKQSGDIGLKALKATISLMETLNEEYHTFQRIVLASFHQEIYQELVRLNKEEYPQLLYSPAIKGAATFFIMQLLKLDIFFIDRVAVLQVPMKQSGINLATKSFVKAAHKHNIAVHYWTIDDEEDMKHLIDIGADGIMTNIPSLLKKVLN